MTTRKQARRLAVKLGATIEGGRTGNVWGYNIDAPQGYTWSSDYGLHSIVAWCYDGDKVWREEMWADALARMRYGVEPCEIPNCEFCADENWENAA